jgi:acetyl esterase/lipase
MLLAKIEEPMIFLSQRFTDMRHAIMRYVILATIIVVIGVGNRPLAAQTSQATNTETRVQYHPSPQVRAVPDIVFARYRERLLRLDLYLPVGNKKPVPGVIVIRGGGWMVNDRKEFAHVASALADRGVAAASIEYRTADEAVFPGAVQDVKAAVRWMRAHAKLYDISPDMISTLGGSSGAYMALLAGLTDDRELEGLGGNNNVSSRVQAVVAMGTPTHLSRLGAGGRSVVTRFLHASLEQDPKLWDRASPVNHVRAGGPSILLIHGTADEAVLPEQSSGFAELCRKAGGNVELVMLPKAPHPFWNYMPWFEDTMNRAGTFLHRVASELAESQFSRSDFQKLRWLEGTWRGSGGGSEAFYERYHFINDSTIEIEYFGKDQTLTQLKRKGSVSLQGRAIVDRHESAVWAAISVDEKSVHFAPKDSVHNSFSWEKQSADLWIAHLNITDSQGKQRELVFRMERIKSEKN